MQFEFKTKSMSAMDAYHLFGVSAPWSYQLAVAASDDVHHEIMFSLDDAEPGEPTSPVIRQMTLSPSGMYVEIKFRDTPVYMTVPAMSTVTLGWLEPVPQTDQERRNHEAQVAEISALVNGDPWHTSHRHNAPPNA
jgi:hypothetical protein